nr:MAG TPA: FMRP KH0 domain [Caudoviricetes sp.]
MAQLGNLTLENARIFFKDFSAEGRFANGKRTFCVEVPEDLVDQLQRDGWNLNESRVSAGSGCCDLVY